ncbi:MAG: hypothetical protein ACTHKJ_03830 [Candidatus Nitrosocosmicus sp.]
MVSSNNIDKSIIKIIAFIIVSLFLSSIFNLSTFTSHAARPDVGFQDGMSDCQSGTSNAINSHSNAGHHTAEYMAAYKRGLASCDNSGSNNNINQGIATRNPVSSDQQLTQSATSIAPQQQTTAAPIAPLSILNENNNNLPHSNETTSDFNSICYTLQTGLFDLCSQLVNPDGNLTTAGNTTVRCIITSVMLNVGATVLEIQPSFINNTLTNFSDPTGCGGLVKIDQINNLSTATGNMKGIVNQLMRLI